MSENNATPNIANENDAATSEVVRSGFRYGLAGAAVRKGEGSERKVVKAIFRVMDGKQKVAEWDNVEVPYPTNDKAAKEAAADCTTSIYCLNENGDVETVKLTGLAAAVTIALQGRRDETYRGKVRGGKIKGEDQLRKAMLSTYGFTVGRVESRVSKEDLAAILADPNATAEDKLAAMEAMLQSAGVTVK